MTVKVLKTIFGYIVKMYDLNNMINIYISPLSPITHALHIGDMKYY